MRSYFQSVFSCIRIKYGDLRSKSKYRKIRTRNNSVFGHFLRSDCQISMIQLYSKKLMAKSSEFRGSLQEEFCKKVVLKSFANFTGKHLYLSQACNVIKKETLTLWCFPVNFKRILETLFLQNTSGGCIYYFFVLHGPKNATNFDDIFMFLFIINLFKTRIES